MSITDMVIKAVGIILIVVGFALVLGSVGVTVLAISLGASWIVELIVGLVLIAVGIAVVKGGFSL